MNNLCKKTHPGFFSGGLLIFTCFSALTLRAQTPEEKPVLFGEQEEKAIVQSINFVDGERLKHRPVFQMGSSFYGTLPGLNVSLTNGLASNQLSYSLRGGTPLILVDGIPRSAVNIPIEQIESVSVINDATGVSMLGMMGGNGMINITTKKGNQSGLKVGFTAQFASMEQMFKPKYLNSYDYAVLFNEALANDGIKPTYSQADLDKYKNGSSPYTHPNTSWYDYLLKSDAFVQKYNLNFIGGGDVARYYIDLNYYDQDGFFKEDKSLNPYSTRESFEKYSIRTNVDVNITKNTLFAVNIFGQMFKENTPGGMMGTLYSTMAETPNNAYAPVNPDGSLGGNRIYKNNLYGLSVHAGYYTYNATDLNFDAKLTHRFDGALEGAYAGLLYSYNAMYRGTVNRSKTLSVFGYDVDAGGNENYTELSTAGVQANSSSYNRQNRMMYIEGNLGYDFQIGKHTSKNQIIYSYNNYLIQNELPFNNFGVSGRFQYDYEKRYFAELTLSYMGMNQYKKGHKWGLFPALGLGWEITGEDWFNASVFDKLKLRASYGRVGNNTAAAYFQNSTGTPSYYYDYMSRYVTTSSAYFSNSATAYTSIMEERLPYLSSWEKIDKLNIGIDAVLLKNRLSVSAEYFNNKTSDVLMYRQKDNSGIIGIPLPMENLGSYRTQGVEFTAGYSDQVNDFRWTVEGNVTMYSQKAINMNDPYYPEPYMMTKGKNIWQPSGYICDGFFQSQEDIDNYLATNHIEGYTPVPGDLKYRDLNNDNVIDQKDITSIGTSKPMTLLGLYGAVSWKGIGFNMQWAGLLNRDIITNDDMPFGLNSQNGYGQARESHLDRWTPTNKNAEYPRLSVGKNDYNQRTSTFWIQNGSYLRLKHIELSYDLPTKWISALKMTKAQIFATGYNLLTITGLKDRDPEMPSFSVMPNTKSVSLGVNIEF